MFAFRVEQRREYIDSEYKMQSCPDFLKTETNELQRYGRKLNFHFHITSGLE